MKTTRIFFAIAVATLLSTSTRAEGDAKAERDGSTLDRYFADCCEWTGNLGVGFVASHTYNYEFRQRLRMTQDQELKRLYVLEYLYGETESNISDFEKGIIQIPMKPSRKMTKEERTSAEAGIRLKLRDLAELDPGDPQKAISEYQRRLDRATHGKK